MLSVASQIDPWLLPVIFPQNSDDVLKLSQSYHNAFLASFPLKDGGFLALLTEPV
jgi:hypothetical protein